LRDLTTLLHIDFHTP